MCRKGQEKSEINALVLILCCRALSGLLNTIHDCDEVFNYWEPLHYVMYGFGLQTWEYSAEFALRSWWYILIHSIIGVPLSSLMGKRAAFYSVRLVLAMVTGVFEWMMYKSICSSFGKQIARVFFILSCASSGMFVSCSAFLPSSFAMVAMIAAVTGVLRDNHGMVVYAAVIGTAWGWAVASLSFVPFAIWVLWSCTWTKAFGHLFGAVTLTLVPLTIVDRIFYGTWKVRVCPR